MSAALHLTWDGSEDEEPRRPSTEDMGGDQLEDDQDDPPTAGMPAAGGWNQKAKQIPALSKVADAAQISVMFSGGTPSIAYLACPASTEAVDIDTFEVTDNGDGDTSITWPANTFPPAMVNPHSLTINSDTEIDRARAIPITNGVRVKTKLGATGTDANFTVCISG